MIYPPNQKPPIWSIDPGIIAYNCQKAGMPHPMLAMPFWEKGGDRVLDYSGRGNHGAITGAEWVADGLDFVAANSDYVNIPDADSLGMVTEMTIVSRIKQPALAIRNTLVAKWDYKTQGSWTFSTGNTLDDELHSFIAASLTDAGFNHGQTTDVNMVAGNTYDNVMVYSGSGATNADRLKMFSNGTQKTISFTGTIPASLQNSTASVKIGKFGGTLTRYFNGTISNIILFNTALTAAQIKLLHDDPYFMYRAPEQLYGYAAAAAGVTIPVFLHHYNQMRQ